jgi:hypothetical protein
MTRKAFETNAEVTFIVDDWEFSARQSPAELNGTWYVYHYSICQSCERLEPCPNPFTEYDKFLVEAGKIAKKWIRKNCK